MSATMSSRDGGIVNLLRFPVSPFGAFSNFKPGLKTTLNESLITPTVLSGSSSPPRKSARLEGDEDHSTAALRSRDKGKGRETDVVRPVASTKIGVVVSPHEPVSEAYLESLKGPLHSCISYILKWKPHELDNPRVTPRSYEWIFQATQSLVLIAGKGHWVYEKLRVELTVCVKDIANTLIKLEPSDKVLWLVQLVSAARWYNACAQRLEVLLTYLDRVYIPKQQEVLTVRQLAGSIFQRLIFEHALITEYLTKGVESWAEYERTNRIAHKDRPIIVELLDILYTYGLLNTLFLDTYNQATQTYYRDESERLALSDEYKDYPKKFLEHVSQRLEEEKDRSVALFAKYEWCSQEIEGSTEKSLMEGRLTWLSKGIITAMDNKDMEGLCRMYKLFSRVDGLKLLCDEFKLHVHNTVQTIVKDPARDEEMIDRLLDFKAFVDSALPRAFSDSVPVKGQAKTASSVERATARSSPMTNTTKNNDKSATEKISNQRFIYAATDAFQTGFRARRNKPAEMIAKHIDRAMRKGQRGASDADFSKMLDAILVLYRFTQDRDVFRTFYHRALAKRLLLQRSASDDFEKSVLKRLKEHYDSEFGMGDQMFRDLQLSRDIMNEFHSKADTDRTAEQLTVMVLQSSFWPFSARQRQDILLPTTMQKGLDKYLEFYKKAHQGHKLDFDHSLGTMQLRARFKPAEKELSVSLYQGVILLLFNDQDEIEFKELKRATEMDDAELRRTLQSLACGNKKVLKKKPAGRDVNDDDVFYFNGEFTDPRPKVHINSIQAKETPEETKRTHISIEGDRKHYLDAAIVRIMKAKKTMSHQKLIPETIEAVKSHFAPEVRVIKERIEQLIEQEYIRRDDEQDNVYVYVA